MVPVSAFVFHYNIDLSNIKHTHSVVFKMTKTEFSGASVSVNIDDDTVSKGMLPKRTSSGRADAWVSGSGALS
jgi:hypothetical protein